MLDHITWRSWKADSARHAVRWGVGVLLCLSAGFHSTLPAQAATDWYVATTGNDESTCRSEDTPCRTIAAAIAKAAFQDSIRVAAGTYIEHLVVQPRSYLTITGAGAGLTFVDGDRHGRVVDIASNAVARLTNLSIRNGQAPAPEGGHGVRNRGTLFLERVVVVDNSAPTDMTGQLVSSGGGIENDGDLFIEYSTITRNRARSGGGIDHVRGRLELNATSVLENTATGAGAGVVVASGVAMVLNTVIAGNRTAGTADLSLGGGLVALSSSTVALQWSTIAGNTASAGGQNLAGGSTSRFDVRGTILASIEPDSCSGGITLSSQGYNIDSGTSCRLTAVTDRSALDPQLRSLPTDVRLRDGSPAIDVIDDVNVCPLIDRAEQLRPLDGDSDGISRCDIGAYEDRAWRPRAFVPTVSR